MPETTCRAAAEADELRAALVLVKAERDSLISACVWEFWWRSSPRGELRHGWRWVVGNRSSIEDTEELARAAVRAAAGPDGEGRR
jgi:hypothetical protein